MIDAILAPGYRREAQRRADDSYAKAEKVLLRGLHPKQRAFVLDPGRRVAALVARGGGKTTGGRARFMRRMLRTPKAKCLYIVTTKEDGRDLMWEPLKDICERLGVGAHFNETRLVMRLRKNGAQLKIVGADDRREIEKQRGKPFHEVGIDEAASHRPEILESILHRIIGPRLGDFGGMLWTIGTPGHVLHGPFYEATRVGSEIGRLWEDRHRPEFKNWLRWSVHQWSLQDGAPYIPAMARLWEEARREKEANGWTDDNPVWKREYLGLWAADDTENVFKYRPHVDGVAWNQWDPERDPRTKIAKLPPGSYEFVYGMDMGHSDPFALEVFAYSYQDGNLYHVFEFVKKGMYARTIAEQLIGSELRADNPAGIIGETGWPMGMVADLAGLGGALIEELAAVYGVRIDPAEKKHRFDAIEIANGDLIDGRIKILKGSQLETQLLNLQWAVDQYGNLQKDKRARDDCADAFIYARRKVSGLMGGPIEPTKTPEDEREPDEPPEPEQRPEPEPYDIGDDFEDPYGDEWEL